jgi:hypothetical protein
MNKPHTAETTETLTRDLTDEQTDELIAMCQRGASFGEIRRYARDTYRVRLLVAEIVLIALAA